ncbi:hypothetical protein FZEAL_2545 [Fusarium zealandicum]|uniref:UvrD-like helicase C-terminal domain-containing protein n=1 Tax=Fusarium zealandicum TaxID=1053134 RepID=A0A8H4UQP4_9HYPO|nr:hypothetical protein FZEAL_2545 [Fusarium zealandicum]
MVPRSFCTGLPVPRALLQRNFKVSASYLLNSSRFFTQSHGLLKRGRKKPPFVPSPQQTKVATLSRSQNVVVSARPGSGKTATAEAIIAANPDKRVAVLTYSKRLQLDTYRRLITHDNCEVFTFHGMAGLLFQTVMSNDAKLSEQRARVSQNNELPQWDYAPFDIIVLDEFQDCTELIFWLISCFIVANEQTSGGTCPRLVVLGDERQSIYHFRGADHRYLTLAPELLGPISPYPFVQVPLSESFRLSDQCVRFVNYTFLEGELYIASSKAGPQPIVLRCNPNRSYALAKRISSLIEYYGAENCAVVAPYLRNHKPLKDLINILSEDYKVPIAVPMDDEAPLSDKVIGGKMCVSTIHQFKGSERDLVILFGIDSAFFSHIGRDLPDDRCPNMVFVALTRAKEQLVLVHDERKKLMPFVSVKALYETTQVIDMTRKHRDLQKPDAPGRPLELGLSLPSRIGVRDMVRHIKDESLKSVIESHLCVRKLASPMPEKDHINIPDVVPSNRENRFYESVSDINGVVVVADFELAVTGELKALGLYKGMVDRIPLPLSPLERVAWLCRYACEYEACLSGYKPRNIQMRDSKFDWVGPDDLAHAQMRLEQEVGDSAANLRFEVEVDKEIKVDNQRTQLHGRADIVLVSPSPDCKDDETIETVWEIKFVSELSDEHIIQVCTYGYLLAQRSGALPRIMLYNVRNGEKWEITPRDGQEGLWRMLESVLRLRYTSTGEMEHDEFIDMCTRTTKEVLSLAGSLE